jgi:hypothetical protein
MKGTFWIHLLLGWAKLHQDLVKDALSKIEENGQNSASQLASLLKPLTACPACSIEEATLERVSTTMAAALSNQDFIVEFQASSGLCIPHPQRLLPSLDGKRQVKILHLQSACLQNLQGELAEFIRKCAYRFRDEEIGKEGDSYKRAADMIKGKRRGAEMNDLI